MRVCVAQEMSPVGIALARQETQARTIKIRMMDRKGYARDAAQKSRSNKEKDGLTLFTPMKGRIQIRV